jgi:hypothetical protein
VILGYNDRCDIASIREKHPNKKITVQLTWSNELAVYNKQLSRAEIGDDYDQVIEGVGG